MVKSYVINGKNFGTRKQLVEYIQSILHRYSLGDRLNAGDFEFIMDLLSHHSEAQEKIGCGIVEITTGKNKGGTTCFYLRRKDDSKDDFSYVKCIENY